jgi:alcohol dehydrogenase (cytochrome c)
MSRRLEIIMLALVAVGPAAVGSGITSSRADEAGIEVGVGELRGEILSLFAPPGAIATETNPNYKGAAAPRPVRSQGDGVRSFLLAAHAAQR